MLIYRNVFEVSTFDANRGAALDNAIRFARIGLDNPEIKADRGKSCACKVSLANCLRDEARTPERGASLDEAIQLLEEAARDYWDYPTCGALMPHVFNSLGASLMTLASRGDASGLDHRHERALNAFSKAVTFSEQHLNRDVWGAARANIGTIYMHLAARKEPEEAAFLRLRAISEFRAAIDAYPEAQFPIRFASAQTNVGQLYVQHAMSHDDPHMREAYLFRSLQAFEIATEIVRRDRESDRWAQLQASIGAVFHAHSDIAADATIAVSDLERAAEYYGAACTAYREASNSVEAANCSAAIERAQVDAKRISANQKKN